MAAGFLYSWDAFGKKGSSLSAIRPASPLALPAWRESGSTARRLPATRSQSRALDADGVWTFTAVSRWSRLVLQRERPPHRAGTLLRPDHSRRSSYAILCPACRIGQGNRRRPG